MAISTGSNGSSRRPGRGVTAMADTALAGDPFRLELAEFARAIRDGTEARIGATDGLEALRIALAADESARTGAVVRLRKAAG
jgi:predicted dehydrogenase